MNKFFHAWLVAMGALIGIAALGMFLFGVPTMLFASGHGVLGGIWAFLAVTGFFAALIASE